MGREKRRVGGDGIRTGHREGEGGLKTALRRLPRSAWPVPLLRPRSACVTLRALAPLSRASAPAPLSRAPVEAPASWQGIPVQFSWPGIPEPSSRPAVPVLLFLTPSAG